MIALRSLAVAATVAVLGATAPPAGLRSTGTLVVQTSFSGTPLTIGGNVSLVHKGALYRLDLLSLGLPGSSGDVTSALAATLLPQGGVSAVYDGASGALTVWSDRNRTYYAVASARSAAPSAANAVTTGAAAAGDPLAALAQIAGALQNVQTASIQLLGHPQVNGHQATSLDVQVKRQLPGKNAESYHAQLALADDLGGFPVQLTLQVVPASSSQIGGTAKLDLTSIQAQTPDDAVFATPSGYRRVESLSGILSTR